MTEEREDEDGGTANVPFDENPPVDPGQAQVGNSKARFFVPRDEGSGDEGEGQDHGESGDHGDAQHGEGGGEGGAQRDEHDEAGDQREASAEEGEGG